MILPSVTAYGHEADGCVNRFEFTGVTTEFFPSPNNYISGEEAVG
jgi:hypothetical protein